MANKTRSNADQNAIKDGPKSTLQRSEIRNRKGKDCSPPPKSKRPKNVAEGEFFDLADSAGWRVSKRGWPDFFLTKSDGSIACVEVKPHANRALKREQREVLDALAAYGIPCFRWSPDVGLQGIDGSAEEKTAPSVGREIWQILKGGLDSLSENDYGRPWPNPKRDVLRSLVAEYDPDILIRAAWETREIVQAQDRAPNISSLYLQKVEAAAKVRKAVRGALA